MNFPSKLTLAVATAAVLCPIAAYAGPTTGSTAAAVSIKFEGSAATGYSTISPGGATNAGGRTVSKNSLLLLLLAKVVHRLMLLAMLAVLILMPMVGAHL